MNVSKMSREKIAAALAKGGRYMNHARQWVAVKVGERVNPDDIALALVSPDALIVREAVRMASKAGRGAKRAAGAVARKVRKNPTGTGAAAVGERGGWSIVKPEKRDDAHYLEALEGQGALFGGLGRETTLHQNPAKDPAPAWAVAAAGEGPGPWPWLRLTPEQWGELHLAASRAAVSAVALAPGGFWRAWRDASFDPANLSPEWLRKRDAFAARSVAQMRDAGETIRRDLALRVWAIHPAAALAKLRNEKGLR